MDLVREVGALALATRLRRLADRFQEGVAIAVRERGLDFEPRWAMLYYLLASSGPASITDAARALGVSHPAVNGLAQELLKSGYVEEQSDLADRRRRLLALSEAGTAILPSMQELWRDVGSAASLVGSELLAAVERVEEALERVPFHERIRGPVVEIIEYRPEYQEAWKSLNIAWVAQEYTVEEEDLRVLDDPLGVFIRPGGFVFLARVGSEIVGTAALCRVDADTFELCKMTVSTAMRGRQVGQKLMAHCLQVASARGARRVTLETNKKAVAAIGLYEKHGFEHRPFPTTHPSAFARADVYMVKELYV